MKQFPLVSVIMPIYNEAEYIKKAVESVIMSDYPHNKLEVLVVDGMSNDGTRDIVAEIASEDSRIRLIDNPQKIQAVAMNIGLREMKGQLFARLDGHAEISNDFIKNSVRCAHDKSDAWIVGGAIDTISESYVGKAISFAMQTPVGVGNAMFRRGDFEGWVDTLAFGMHHSWVIDKIGFFDESLVRNEDDDFNFRIRKAGGKIWLSKDINSIYYSRSSLKKLWRQYYQYGFWRIKTIQKHKTVVALRQLAPVVLTVSLFLLMLLSFVHPWFKWLFVVELGVYLLGLFSGALIVWKEFGFSFSLSAPVIFAILHFSYGIGMLLGWVRFIVMKGYGLPSKKEYSVTR